MARASATMSAFPSATIASACPGSTISPTARVTIAGVTLHLLGEGGIGVGGNGGPRAPALTPPEETQTKSSLSAFQCPGERHRVVRAETASIQSLPVMRAHERHPLRDDLADGACDLQRKAHAGGG